MTKGWGGGGGAKSELWVRIEKGKELAVVAVGRGVAAVKEKRG